MELRKARLGLKWATLGLEWTKLGFKETVEAQIGQVGAESGHARAYTDLFGAQKKQVGSQTEKICA